MNNSGSGLLRCGTVPSSLFCDFIGDSGEKDRDLLRHMEERKSSANNGLAPQYPRKSSASATQSAAIDTNSGFPARLFSHLTTQNGCAPAGGFGNYRMENGNNGEATPYSSRSRGLMNVSFSGVPSSSGLLSQMAAIENFSFGSWNTQTSVELAAMDKLRQFQDAVPFKVRAKRGCATHPRSVAERVRRTRISERMKTLQKLVPNMDRQTNTADMLDLAVGYIKDLQEQCKVLSEIQGNCKCSSMQKPLPNLSA